MSITVQFATDDVDLPAAEQIGHWAATTLASEHCDAEMTVRIVGRKEGERLNREWRGRDGATNVLAFPLDGPHLTPSLLGDVVICAPVAAAQSAAGSTGVEAHFAHLVVHGTLHLLGYDHLGEDDARAMESLERTILAELGYPDPYV